MTTEDTQAINKIVENEVRVIVKLSKSHPHRNIVAVLRYGEVKGSTLYYIDMELCDWNLAEFIRHRYATPIQFTTWDDVWWIMSNIAAGLVFIHDLGEVHRDLKPSNGSVIIRLTVLIASIVRAKR